MLTQELGRSFRLARRAYQELGFSSCFFLSRASARTLLAQASQIVAGDGLPQTLQTSFACSGRCVDFSRYVIWHPTFSDSQGYFPSVMSIRSCCGYCRLFG